MIRITPSSTPLFIQRLKAIILSSTIIYSCIYGILTSFWQDIAHLFTTSPLHSSLVDGAKAPLSALTLTYHDISFQMLFDFLILNLILTPLVSFVFSFLGKKRFSIFLLTSSIVSALVLHGFSHVFDTRFFPTTLFSHLALSILGFWAMLGAKDFSTRFVFIPLKPGTVLVISLICASYGAFLAHDWIKIGALISSLFYGYFVAVACFRMRSSVLWLQWFEKAITSGSLCFEKLWWRMRARKR